jgi:hypothetical protein
MLERIERYKEEARQQARARREQRKAELKANPGPNAEEIMRLAKLTLHKDAANKPRDDERMWNGFISYTMRSAETILENITRPPTELWALREKFLDDVFGIAMLTPKDGEIPEVDEEEIEAMYAPKPHAEFVRRI